MHKQLLVACSLAVVGVTGCLASPPVSAQQITRERLKSDVGIELLGKAAIYCFSYQYTPIKMVGLEAGLGAIGGGSGGNNAMLAFVPLGAKLYLVPKDGSLYLTGGVTIVSATTNKGPFSDTGTYGYAGLGFEFRAETGFTFRGTAYGLFSGNGFFIWPGLAFAYSF
jgi:hypothetical protein